MGRLADGRVIFVPGTAPGDRVHVGIEQEKKRFVRGRVLEVVEPGPGRCEPRCAVFGQCGGCAWQHLEYSSQLQAKRQIVEDAVGRIAKLPIPETIVVHASPVEYGYRTRTRVLGQAGRIGYRSLGSNNLCAVDGCPVLVGPLENALRDLKAPEVPSQDPCEFELVAAPSGAVRVAGLPADESQPLPSGPPIDVVAGGERLVVSPGVFLQANASLFDALIEAVAGAAQPGKSPFGLALELFAGAGFLTRRLARCFDAVVAVESFGPAVRDLEGNLAFLEIDNVEVVQAKVEEMLAASALRPDVIVLDPPRSGLPGPALAPLAAMEGTANRLSFVRPGDPGAGSREPVPAGPAPLVARNLRPLSPDAARRDVGGARAGLVRCRASMDGPLRPARIVVLREGHPMQSAVDHFGSKRDRSSFLLYLEGPRDREILKNWCRRISPALARAVDTCTILLGGRQPLRAVEHHRGLLDEGALPRGICILDRDGLPETPPGSNDAPGLEFFTWPRRHIESYLLVPAAILRGLPRKRDLPALERLVGAFLPDAGDEASFRELDAKRLLSARGPLGQVAGRDLRPGRIARNMAEAEMHPDVMSLLSRIREGFGLQPVEIQVIGSPVRTRRNAR